MACGGDDLGCDEKIRTLKVKVKVKVTFSDTKKKLGEAMGIILKMA